MHTPIQKNLTQAQGTLRHAIATCRAVRERVRREDEGHNELHDMQTVVAYYRQKMQEAQLSAGRRSRRMHLH